MSIELHREDYLLVLTGAGISAESGLATFRGAQGLWEGHRVEEVASPEGFERDPELVLRFYGLRRQAALSAKPNPAHQVLAKWEEYLGDNFLLVTQNVDDLHRRAGSQRLVEVHGNLFRTRCHWCALAPYEDRCETFEKHQKDCARCQAHAERISLRPDIVWFGEMLNPEHLLRIENFIGRASRTKAGFHFMAIGTSGNVYPAAGLVRRARQAGAKTYLVNLEEPTNHQEFLEIYRGKAAEILPNLFALGGQTVFAL